MVHTGVDTGPVGAGGWGDRERKEEVLGSTPFPVLQGFFS